MAVSNIKASFPVSVEEVWNIVTSNENYLWRSDLSRIEVIDSGKTFIEYTKDNYSTRFMITVFEPYKRYEFDMENSNMKGHWTGMFSYENGKTTISFTEEVNAKKFFMKPFVKMYLKKQQETYVKDLEKEIENNSKN